METHKEDWFETGYSKGYLDGFTEAKAISKKEIIERCDSILSEYALQTQNIYDLELFERARLKIYAI